MVCQRRSSSDLFTPFHLRNKGCFVATRDIQPGELLTVSYLSGKLSMQSTAARYVLELLNVRWVRWSITGDYVFVSTLWLVSVPSVFDEGPLD